MEQIEPHWQCWSVQQRRHDHQLDRQSAWRLGGLCKGSILKGECNSMIMWFSANLNIQKYSRKPRLTLCPQEPSPSTTAPWRRLSRVFHETRCFTAQLFLTACPTILVSQEIVLIKVFKRRLNFETLEFSLVKSNKVKYKDQLLYYIKPFPYIIYKSRDVSIREAQHRLL